MARIPRTHCKRGHAMTEDNVKFTVVEGRPCRACKACYKMAKSRADKKCYAKNRAKRIAYAKAWSEANRERCRAVRKAHYEANKEVYRERNRSRRASGVYCERNKVWQAKYALKKREVIRANGKKKAKEKVDTLHDTYVRFLMGRCGYNKEAQRNTELVEAYRLTLQLKRAVGTTTHTPENALQTWP